MQKHRTSKQEIESLRELVKRDLSDAGIEGLSDDRRFATAYNALLQLSKMAIACTGYRISIGAGHHQKTFEAAKTALGTTDAEELADYFETCRRKRNKIDYDAAEIVSEIEANEILAKAVEFQNLVKAWIARNHPLYNGLT